MAKLRRVRSKRQEITQAALHAYKAAGPGSVDVQGHACLICDRALADALGVPALIWWPRGADLVARLEQAARADGAFVGD
jgi:hypothetical protein